MKNTFIRTIALVVMLFLFISESDYSYAQADPGCSSVSVSPINTNSGPVTINISWSGCPTGTFILTEVDVWSSTTPDLVGSSNWINSDSDTGGIWLFNNGTNCNFALTTQTTGSCTRNITPSYVPQPGQYLTWTYWVYDQSFNQLDADVISPVTTWGGIAVQSSQQQQQQGLQNIPETATSVGSAAMATATNATPYAVGGAGIFVGVKLFWLGVHLLSRFVH